MKVRFNPETQDCEMLVGDDWQPLKPTDAPGDYCAFEIPETATDALRSAGRRALPLLQKLGDFIGNGPTDPSNPTSLGERCDTILALRRALDAFAAPAPVPTFDQLLAWCEFFDGDPTEGWLLRVLSGEITIDNFNRAVLANRAPEVV